MANTEIQKRSLDIPDIEVPVQTLLTKVEDHIRRHNLLADGQRVSVGFSGGADSTALLLVLHSLGYEVYAVHFNHHLRGDAADKDEAWCRDLCTTRAVPFESISLDVAGEKTAGESIEMAARRLRLAYWKAVDGVVALGHHKDDALETCLLNMCRGGNASSLSSLQPDRVIGGVKLIRPLLCLTRSEIENYLSEQGITNPCEDASNDDGTYKRNRVRHEMLPLLEELAGGRNALYQTLEHLQQDAKFIEDAVPDVGDLTPNLLRQAPPAIRFRLLRDQMTRWCEQRQCPGAVPGSAVQRILDALDEPIDSPKLIDFDKDYFIRLTPDSLEMVVRGEAVDFEPIEWRWRETPALTLESCGIQLSASLKRVEGEMSGAELFDATVMPDTLIVRPRHDGDRMVPFGHHSPKKLKKLISDAKLGVEEKRQLVIIAIPDGEIIWVPGVKRAEFGRVSDDTGSVVRLQIDARP